MAQVALVDIELSGYVCHSSLHGWFGMAGLATGLPLAIVKTPAFVKVMLELISILKGMH
jgi:hypothetical protein